MDNSEEQDSQVEEMTDETPTEAPAASPAPSAPSQPQNQHKVFVGNLPYTITEDELKQVFQEVGGFKEEDITEVIILKEKSPDPSRPPRSRGIGFVGFTNQENMQKAIEKVNGTEVEYVQRGENMKRPIFVNEARPFVPREERNSSNY